MARWLGALAFAVVSTGATSATITIAWNSPAFNPGGVNVGTINFPVGQTTGADAGRFEGTATAWSGIDSSTFYASVNDFFAYCFDLEQTLQGGAMYTVSPGAPMQVRNFLGAVNSVLDGDAYRWLAPASSNEAAAIQLGIWEALYDDDFVTSTGDVRFQTVNPTIAGLFSSFVAAMASTPDLDAQYVMVLQNRERQDVITGVRGVPEPATLLLVAGAALAGGLARRRR
jgi:hypothetical protein